MTTTALRQNLCNTPKKDDQSLQMNSFMLIRIPIAPSPLRLVSSLWVKFPMINNQRTGSKPVPHYYGCCRFCCRFFSVRSLASLPMMMEPIEFTCTADDQAGQKRLGGRRKRRNTARPRSSPVDIYGCAPGTRLNWSALPPLARYLLLMTTALDGNDPQVKRGDLETNG